MASNSVPLNTNRANTAAVPAEQEKTCHVSFGAWSDGLFSVNAGVVSIDALSHADLFTSHVRRMLQGAMNRDRESADVSFEYDDLMVMDFLLEMAHACRTAAGAVA